MTRLEYSLIRLLSGRQIQSSLLKRMLVIQTPYSTYKNGIRFIRRLQQKGIIQDQSGFVRLTPYGHLVARYLFPFPSLQETHQTCITVSLKTAGEETGYSLNSLSRKKAPFYYLNCFKKLYVLKKELNSELKKRFPFFPLLALYEIPELLPNFPTKGLLLIKKNVRFVQKKDEFYFHWTEILDFLLSIGTLYEPETTKETIKIKNGQ